jgi:scyllo-inositol 2-dehydrogenase (NADP+)
MTQIRVGLAGFGASARTFHLPLLLALPERFRVAAVLERQARDAPGLLPAATVHAALADFTADPAIDLAVVCLPNELHAEVAIALLEAGKHVVVEKPLAITSAECEAMIAAARRTGRYLFVFHSRLLDDLGSHLLDQALTLFGPPRALGCRLGIQRDGSQTVDAYRISLDYPGLWVDLESSMVVRAGPFHWALHGTEGSLLKSGIDPQESQLQQGVSPLDPHFGVEDEAQAGWLHPRDGAPRRVPTPKGRYLAFYQNVADVLAGTAAPLFPAEDGLAVVRLLEACRQSAAERADVTL